MSSDSITQYQNWKVGGGRREGGGQVSPEGRGTWVGDTTEGEAGGAGGRGGGCSLLNKSLK